MGFNLAEGVSRRDAAAALVRFASARAPVRAPGAQGPAAAERRPRGPGFESDATLTYEVDLADDEQAIFGRMSSACRRAIRKAEKVGVTVEPAAGPGFADEYYAQLLDVFARQSLVPTYGVERVRALIACLEPTGRLLLLRALSPDGRSIATGIFPAFNGTAYFWGGASLRADQILRPNEALFWYAMQLLARAGHDRRSTSAAPATTSASTGRASCGCPGSVARAFPVLSLMRTVARGATKRRQAWSGRRAS